jgi:hypothetical protein
VVKYADNIHKGFATSASIVISSLLDTMLFDDVILNTAFCSGSFLVLASTVGFLHQTATTSGDRSNASTMQSQSMLAANSLVSRLGFINTPQGRPSTGSTQSEDATKSSGQYRINGVSVWIGWISEQIRTSANKVADYVSRNRSKSKDERDSGTSPDSKNNLSHNRHHSSSKDHLAIPLQLLESGGIDSSSPSTPTTARSDNN